MRRRKRLRCDDSSRGSLNPLRGADASVVQGRFGANMRVSLEGDGPVTIVVSTDGWAEGDLGRR